MNHSSKGSLSAAEVPLLRRLALACPLLAVLYLLLISGCSNNPNPVGIADDDTMFVAFTTEPIDFDPTSSYTSDDAAMMDLVYPCYFRYNYLKQVPYETELNVGLIEPIREAYVGTGDDGKPFKGEKWTFEIKHGIRFQDDPCFRDGKGREVLASDIEFAYKRMANPKMECPVASYFADKVVGWDKYADGFKAKGDANYDEPFDGVKVDPANPYRFTIFLNQPYPQLRYLMTMHFTTPIPREAVKMYKEELKLKHLVGCGVYKMVSYRPRESMVLEKNENSNFEKYPTSAAPGTDPALLADAGKPLPIAKRIVFKISTETVTTYNLFSQGYIDSWTTGKGNAQFILRGIRPGAEMEKRGVHLIKGSYPAIDYFGFNMKDPTFGGYTPQKRKLRQAISLSIDSDDYDQLMYEGLAEPGNFLLPKGLDGYDPNYKNPYRQFDPKLTRAKQLLAEAGYPGGKDPKTHERLVINYDNGCELPVERERDRLFIREIEALGLKVISRDTNYAKFNDKLNHSQSQLFNYGWIADYPDPENFVFLLYGKNSAPGPNSANYDNPEYNRLFEQMRGMDDGPAREAIIKKMRDIAVEDCPWIYVCEVQSSSIFQPWVRNQYSNPLLVDFLKYRGVDHEMRKKLLREWNQPVWSPAVILFVVILLAIYPAVKTVETQRNRRVRKPAKVEDR